jgi:hypothetical protein
MNWGMAVYISFYVIEQVAAAYLYNEATVPYLSGARFMHKEVLR